VLRGGKETGERERALGAAVGSTGQRTWPATTLDRQAWAATLFHEHGRAAGRG
jgi:hypothetical protein